MKKRCYLFASVRIWLHCHHATSNLVLARICDEAGDRRRAIYYALKFHEHMDRVKELER